MLGLRGWGVGRAMELGPAPLLSFPNYPGCFEIEMLCSFWKGCCVEFYSTDYALLCGGGPLGTIEELVKPVIFAFVSGLVRSGGFGLVLLGMGGRHCVGDLRGRRIWRFGTYE